ncbi:unnamed protein product [Lactuca saligna]|uniref:Peptidase A1 domain-containing protein n=1 Tax=Lactuca saligna TaxID=75948 RepID=A0AA35VR46_LACSI|nr:unnamed protein product [Lactuca saligna]
MELNKGEFTVLVIGFVVLFHMCLLGSANVVFQVQHKFSGNKKLLTEFKAHDSERHRRILSAVHLPIGGDSNPTSAGLYFSKIRIGTPGKDYQVQIDTGSDLLWVNGDGCKKCPRKSKNGASLPLYDPKASTTAKIVTCDQGICSSILKGATSNCKVGSHCSYSVNYGDGSAATGYFVRDIVQLDRVSGDLQTTTMNGSIAFGCGSQQSGELGLSELPLDGMLGFGQADSSMLSQLASAKKVKKIFSHSLDGSKGGGIFTTGEVVHPKVKTTPMMSQRGHYNVELKAIQVGNDVLQLPKDMFGVGTNQGTIIDSGTTLAYLPDFVYKQLINKINVAQPNLKSHIVDQQFTCYKYSGNVEKGFPVVAFNFQNSLSLKVYPHQYLFEVEDSNLQTEDGKEITLLGDVVLTDKLVTYDVEKKTIGWIEHKCSSTIKVKDDESKKVYMVHGVKISHSSRVRTSTGIAIVSFLFFMLITFINPRLA